jgi:hypothetical protein
MASTPIWGAQNRGWILPSRLEFFGADQGVEQVDRQQCRNARTKDELKHLDCPLKPFAANGIQPEEAEQPAPGNQINKIEHHFPPLTTDLEI